MAPGLAVLHAGSPPASLLTTVGEETSFLTLKALVTVAVLAALSKARTETSRAPSGRAPKLTAKLEANEGMPVEIPRPMFVQSMKTPPVEERTRYWARSEERRVGKEGRSRGSPF